MKLDGKEVRFMVDSAPVSDPWHSEAGTVYVEVSQSVLDVFHDAKKRVVGPETDEYGTFYSSLAPVFAPNGAILAVMGADIDVRAYNEALLAKRAPIAAANLLVALLYTFAVLVVRYRRLKSQYIRSYTKRLELMIDQMPVGVVIVEGREGFPTMSNEAALRLFGRGIDPNKSALSFTETYSLESEDGSPYPTEELPVSVTLATGNHDAKAGIFVRQKDKSRLAIRMASVPIKDERENIAAVVVVLEDMTAEYEADRQKSEFIAIASHELRTPLTAIRWNTELLLDKNEGPLNEDQRIYATQISEVNVRLIALINELLEVTKLETGAEGVSPSMTDVSALIDTSLQVLAGPMKHKRLQLEYHRSPVPEMNIDPLLVGQAITNLLSNAVKYTPEGGIITVKVETIGENLRVSISDTGIGVPKAQQSMLFRKFFRATNASESDTEGTGLGLQISKRAIEMSGGAIGFESVENQGSTFWFTIPLSGSVRKAGLKRY
jgi:signal transduction histidine kinase